MKSSRIPMMFMAIVCLLCLVVSSVYAVWIFCNQKVDSVWEQFGVGISEFIYKPEEVLPDEEQNEFKENHVYLIQNVLDHVQYGINSNNKTVIHDYLADYGVLFGAQNVSGGNLKHILASDGSVAGGVQFAMEKVSDTVYYTYTFSQSDLNDSLEGEYIEVYKTVMEYGANEDGLVCWSATRGYKGRAKTAWCETDKKDVYTILVDSWEET